MDESFTHSVVVPPGEAVTPEQLAVGEVPAADGESGRPTYLPARKFPFRLDGFQRAACACIERGESVLVSAHTSAGKTTGARRSVKGESGAESAARVRAVVLALGSGGARAGRRERRERASGEASTHLEPGKFGR